MIPVHRITRALREGQDAGEPGSSLIGATFYGACVALIITLAWIMLP